MYKLLCLLFQQFCLMKRSNLASVHSLEEYYFLQKLILEQGFDTERTWIGGSDAQQVRLTLMLYP